MNYSIKRIEKKNRRRILFFQNEQETEKNPSRNIEYNRITLDKLVQSLLRQ